MTGARLKFVRHSMAFLGVCLVFLPAAQTEAHGYRSRSSVRRHSFSANAQRFPRRAIPQRASGRRGKNESAKRNPRPAADARPPGRDARIATLLSHLRDGRSKTETAATTQVNLRHMNSTFDPAVRPTEAHLEDLAHAAVAAATSVAARYHDPALSLLYDATARQEIAEDLIDELAEWMAASAELNPPPVEIAGKNLVTHAAERALELGAKRLERITDGGLDLAGLFAELPPR
jgi:hypothetical protein